MYSSPLLEFIKFIEPFKTANDRYRMWNSQKTTSQRTSLVSRFFLKNEYYIIFMEIKTEMNSPYGRSYIGSVVPTFMTLREIYEFATVNGLDVFQTMFGDSFSTERLEFSPEDVQYVVETYGRGKCFSHLPFTFSLVGTKKLGIFNIRPESGTYFGGRFTQFFPNKIAKAIEYELEITSLLGTGVVIHPGTCVGSVEDSICGAVRFLDSIVYPKGSKLLLENAALEGNKFASFDNICKMLRLCKHKENIGICFDTCHAFAAGDYDLSRLDEIDRLYSDIEMKIGIENLKLIHLNDSVDDFGKHKDRHINSGYGKIWQSDYVLGYFLGRFIGIPMICETEIADTREIIEKFFPDICPLREPFALISEQFYTLTELGIPPEISRRIVEYFYGISLKGKFQTSSEICP
jgi:Xylose isomerase-like TIM barrel